MSEETGYNGWTNYETWSVALIIDNDQGLYNLRRELVRETAEAAREEQRDYWTPEETVKFRVADALKSWVEDLVPEFEEQRDGPMCYLWSQLLNAALSEVDWSEIADSWIQDLAETV